MRIRSLLPLILLAACGREMTAPNITMVLPAGAVRFTPGAFQQTALETVRTCIITAKGKPNLTFGIGDVAWYTMPGASFLMANGALYQGYAGPGWIVLAERQKDIGEATRHELAHQLVYETVLHSSPFWSACGLLVGLEITFTIP